MVDGIEEIEAEEREGEWIEDGETIGKLVHTLVPKMDNFVQLQEDQNSSYIPSFSTERKPEILSTQGDPTNDTSTRKVICAQNTVHQSVVSVGLPNAIQEGIQLQCVEEEEEEEDTQHVTQETLPEAASSSIQLDTVWTPVEAFALDPDFDYENVECTTMQWTEEEMAVLKRLQKEKEFRTGVAMPS